MTSIRRERLDALLKANAVLEQIRSSPPVKVAPHFDGAEVRDRLLGLGQPLRPLDQPLEALVVPRLEAALGLEAVPVAENGRDREDLPPSAEGDEGVLGGE